ncbi:MAG: hypothetical protein MUF31_09535 [Akkermansiaceae bacterium]|nr:hypothetical protein [Akkermansiaceae bacterium]
MRALLLVALAVVGLPLTSCVNHDPDLEPQSVVPDATSRQTPWNSPISGQGGGAMGAAMSRQPRR